MVTTAQIWAGLDEYVGRPLLLARATILQLRHGWVLSHDSAAHLLGLAILRPHGPQVHVTRPGFTNTWSKNGVTHHLASFDATQIVQIDGLASLDRARTAVDIARERGVRHGLVACDSALRMGIARDELEHAHAIMRRWPGVRAARTCVELGDAGAENPNESLARELVLEAGIGVPETQFPVRTREGVKWCDLRVGNHVIEADGRTKYQSTDEGGVASKPADAVAWDERKRERLVRDRRLGVTRLYWEDYWGARRADAITRLRADHADSVARFGSTLPETMAREAEAIRRASPRTTPPKGALPGVG
ncbi:hypothetical protein VV02_09120 [Luteipulveratus mongoliensis]|uniref:AbiEi antitoxin C-terminal domain-containing protein n=1 Tax=Luteipulveratus mongoliensis TaxID=571913 RepID=A0A0K1JHB4_9MICO|nr:hypothetical protein VV02_09120 [Luteipulveratus mongoliensis]